MNHQVTAYKFLNQSLQRTGNQHLFVNPPSLQWMLTEDWDKQGPLTPLCPHLAKLTLLHTDHLARTCTKVIISKEDAQKSPSCKILKINIKKFSHLSILNRQATTFSFRKLTPLCHLLDLRPSVGPQDRLQIFHCRLLQVCHPSIKYKNGRSYHLLEFHSQLQLCGEALQCCWVFEDLLNPDKQNVGIVNLHWMTLSEESSNTSWRKWWFYLFSH